MKLVLTKQEVKGFKTLIETMDSIEGMAPVNRVVEALDKQITTKSYIASMITGRLTIDINEDMLSEFLTITNSYMIESAPILKAIYALGQAIAPTAQKYSQIYGEFFGRYQETEPTHWETLNTIEVDNREAV